MTTESDIVPTALQPSALGTRAYWDDCYKLEISNHASNPDDEGTIWFSDSGAEEKMLQLLEDMADANLLLRKDDPSAAPTAAATASFPTDELSPQHATSFCDLGTGNGHLLFSLRDDGWRGRMLGVDYSSTSVQLARAINERRARSAAAAAAAAALEQGEQEVRGGVEFAEYDILSGESAQLVGSFDVLLDKGTFDAISLAADAEATHTYRRRVKQMLRSGGFLVITSCNWTEQELRHWLQGGSSEETTALTFHDRVKYPSFQFGGQKGQSVVTLCFQHTSIS